MARSRLIVTVIAAALAPSVVLAQASGARAPGAMAPKGPAFENSRFKCDGGRELVIEFATRGPTLFAIVDAGEGPHRLPVQPWDGEEPDIVWTDGVRSLTWSTGVQLMWMDGPTHLMCGRSGEHKH